MASERDKLTPGTGGNRAGRVEVDARGRNVWHWNDDQLDSTTILLKRLENDALELEPTRRLRAAGAAAGEPGPQPERREARAKRRQAGPLTLDETFSVDLGGGFDPYNRS